MTPFFLVEGLKSHNILQTCHGGKSRFGTVVMQFFSSPVTVARLCLLTPLGTEVASPIFPGQTPKASPFEPNHVFFVRLLLQVVKAWSVHHVF